MSWPRSWGRVTSAMMIFAPYSIAGNFRRALPSGCRLRYKTQSSAGSCLVLSLSRFPFPSNYYDDGRSCGAFRPAWWEWASVRSTYVPQTSPGIREGVFRATPPGRCYYLSLKLSLGLTSIEIGSGAMLRKHSISRIPLGKTPFPVLLAVMMILICALRVFAADQRNPLAGNAQAAKAGEYEFRIDR